MQGALIIAPNHMSYLDPPIIACSQRRAVAFMAKEELFRKPFLGWLIRSLDAFPLKRGAGDMDAIRLATSVLKEGKALLIFPEGTRGNGEELGPISGGVASLAVSTGAKILPVGIAGTQKVWPKGVSKIRRGKMTVVFGDPFGADDFPHTATPRDLRNAMTERLQADILDLCAKAGLQLKSASNSSGPKLSHPAETAT